MKLAQRSSFGIGELLYQLLLLKVEAGEKERTTTPLQLRKIGFSETWTGWRVGWRGT